MRNRRNAFQLNGAGLFLAVVDSWECELEPGTFYPPRGAVEAPMPEGWLTQDEDGLSGTRNGLPTSGRASTVCCGNSCPVRPCHSP